MHGKSALRETMPEKTVDPSGLQVLQSTGWSCETAALGTDPPFGCTSQKRIWLSQDVATRWLAFELQQRLEMPSVGGEAISMSLLGLCAWLFWALLGKPNPDITAGTSQKDRSRPDRARLSGMLSPAVLLQFVRVRIDH